MAKTTLLIKDGKIYDVNSSTVIFTYGDSQTIFQSAKGNFWSLDEDTLEPNQMTERQVMDTFLNHFWSEYHNGNCEYSDIDTILPQLRKYTESLETV